MAQEQDSNQIPSTVRDFIASEMVRRGLDFHECVEQLHADFEAVCMEEHALENMGGTEQVAEDYDEAWSKEIRRRRETLASGEAKTVSFAELSARIETHRP